MSSQTHFSLSCFSLAHISPQFAAVMQKTIRMKLQEVMKILFYLVLLPMLFGFAGPRSRSSPPNLE